MKTNQQYHHLPKKLQNILVMSHQLDITNALIFFIAGDLMALSVVDSDFFRNFVGKLDPTYQIPSRRQLSNKLIHDKAEEVKTNVKK